MNTRLSPALVLALLAGLAGAQDKPAPDKPAPDKPTQDKPAKDEAAKPAAKVAPSTPALGTQLIGLDVLDTTGKKLAKVMDLVALDSGELTVVLERETRGLVCVPLTALQPRPEKQEAEKDAEKGTPTAKVEAFTYTGDGAKFASAPTIDNADAVDADALARCREYFAVTPVAPLAEPPKDKAEGTPPPKAKPEGTPENPAISLSPRPVCVNKLLGTEVKDSMGEKVGDVRDVAVDLGRGQLAYVVISTGGVMGMGDKLHGIALVRLTRSNNGKEVSLPVSKDGLKALRGFDIDHLPMNPDLSVSATGGLVRPAASDSNS
jgi:sporulation protein YlmC with PRC-barrel domain